MAANNLISKKELLERYGISYGTLYRWKRLGLIPEEWLVKKSTFTGQETFFNSELICKRVEEILSKKDSESLEEIAKELVKKEDEIPKLIIKTKHGDKMFNATEIDDIVVSAGDRKISIFKKITSEISNFLDNREE